MLSSALFGLQELLVWIWLKFAKWRYPIFFTFTSNSLEQPDAFVQRIHSLSWLKITYEMIKWVLIASLLYWPKNKKNILLLPSEDKQWINIIRSRKTYLLRIDHSAIYRYKDMAIKVLQHSSVEIKLDSGETAVYKLKN